MARTKKTKNQTVVESNDTITFKKTELLQKLKQFLEDESACDGDWFNKVQVEFLGSTMKHVTVTAKLIGSATVELPCAGKTPTKDEVDTYIRHRIENGEWEGFDVEPDEFEIIDIE